MKFVRILLDSNDSHDSVNPDHYPFGQKHRRRSHSCPADGKYSSKERPNGFELIQ